MTTTADKQSALRAPFPYFGGKSRVAPEVWRRFGEVDRYIEPFAGSLAVLLAAPAPARLEVVNDADCLIANFWRAVQRDPDAVCAAADAPLMEAEIDARRTALLASMNMLDEEIKADPSWCDATLAGWWWYGQSADIRGSFGRKTGGGRPICTTSKGAVKHRRNGTMLDTLIDLSRRLDNVKVLCGDWTRACTDFTLFDHMRQGQAVGVFLDPPYAAATGRTAKLYGVECDDSLRSAVQDFCRKHADDSRVRIALCGWDDEYDLPGWAQHAWRAIGSRRGANERIWFSPHCLPEEDSP